MIPPVSNAQAEERIFKCVRLFHKNSRFACSCMKGTKNLKQIMNDICFRIYLRNKWNLDIFHENVGINEYFETGIFKKRHKTLDSVWVV